MPGQTQGCPPLRLDGTVSRLFSSISSLLLSNVSFLFCNNVKENQSEEARPTVEKSKVATPPTKGIGIQEKRPWDEVLDTSPNKKDKIIGDSKGMETI